MADIPTIEELAEQVKLLQDDLAEVKEKSGGMLSSANFREYVITEDIPRMKQLFIERKWDQIEPKQSFIIDPFDPLKLTPYSYDLSIGDEVFSCKSESHSSEILKDSKEEAYKLEPGETIIVRTKEYVALPPCYSATVWPRFNFVREGIFQSMVKIDPTWYGQLGVALTNLSPAKYPIWKGKKFATLIIYELTEDTDIQLFPRHKMLDEKYQSRIPLTGFERILDQNKLKEIGLEDKCRIESNELIIELALDQEEFELLLKLSEKSEWQKTVGKAIRIKTMDALGLPQLDLILDKDPDGVRLSRNEVLTASITQQDLLDTAVERGTPFDLISAIPELIMEKTNNEIMPRIKAEVEASLFPKVVTLTLTVLGFLSLIIAVAAFILDKYKKDSPLAGIDWPGTVVVMVLVMGVVLLFAMGFLIFPKSPRDITLAKRKKKEIQKEIELLRKNTNDEMEKQRAHFISEKKEHDKELERWGKELKKLDKALKERLDKLKEIQKATQT